MSNPEIRADLTGLAEKGLDKIPSPSKKPASALASTGGNYKSQMDPEGLTTLFKFFNIKPRIV